ncbi:MAG TPA: DEAD/DEAH box helicase, partial [Spirochaetia bacterium]|nr:DEAD/DEAH box helicase [Spirochaetia bacterium]
MFHPVVEGWFSRAYGEATEIQALTWPRIAAGANVLVCAETGSGKTLSAFLWAIDSLLTGKWESGKVSVLYVSPLKALNTDIHRNLLVPLHAIREQFLAAGVRTPEVRVRTRSGDTSQQERQQIVRRPPEIFITTPESLNLMLASPRARGILETVKVVILDEIHAVIGSKRGTHLITAIDRLVRDAGDFQRIGLSATIRPPEIAASFLGGYVLAGRGTDAVYRPRPVQIICASQSKRLQVSVVHPRSLLRDSSPQSTEDWSDADTFWERLAESLKRIVARNRTTLIFTNSRRHAEKITLLMNREEPKELVYSHHGSLSREIRSFVEHELKAGRLRGIVATSSLELGIDIGELDEVVLAGTPNSVASAIQRIGRAGHRVGIPTKGTFVPVHSRDYLFAVVMASAVVAREIEELHPVVAPLDVLAQVMLSMVANEAGNVDDLYDEIRTSYPFRDLGRRQFDLVLDMLRGRYADSRVRELAPRLHVDEATGTVHAADGARRLLYRSGGTIPDRGSYDMRLAGRQDGSPSGRSPAGKIGELDEEFVWERTPGEIFSMGAQAWKVVRIGDRDVEVVPAGNAANAIPFWRAEALHRDFSCSNRILEFLERWSDSTETDAFAQALVSQSAADQFSIEEIRGLVRRQRESTGGLFPHRHHLVIERFRDPRHPDGGDQIIFHTMWGGRVNHPFALAFAQAWEERFGIPIEVFADNDSILLFSPERSESF